MRKTARNKHELEEAVAILQQAAELAVLNEKVFIHYQLGLAYRDRWLNENERFMYTPVPFKALKNIKQNARCDSSSHGYEYLVQANTNFRMSCELDPHHSRCFVDLARTYASLCNDTEARINFEKALSCPVDPNQNEYTRDLCCYRREQWHAFSETYFGYRRS